MAIYVSPLWFLLALLVPGTGYTAVDPTPEVQRLAKAFPWLKEAVQAANLPMGTLSAEPSYTMGESLAYIEAIHEQWASRTGIVDDYRACLTNISVPFGIRYYAGKVLGSLSPPGGNLSADQLVRALLASWGLAFSNCSPSRVQQALERLDCVPEPRNQEQLAICQLMRADHFKPEIETAQGSFPARSRFAMASWSILSTDQKTQTVEFWEIMCGVTGFLLTVVALGSPTLRKLFWIIANASS